MTTEVCEHLGPVVDYLREIGYEPIEDTFKGARELVLGVTRWVDVQKLKQSVQLATCVRVWEQKHYYYPLEQGLLCVEDNQVISWPLRPK